MSIIQELENMKYRFVLDLLKNDEQYDKRKNVITAIDAYKICYDRFLLMQEVLLPLKKRLGDEIDLTDITFTNSMQDESGILVKYIKDGKSYILGILNVDFEDIDIISSDSAIQNYDFVDVNRKVIIKTFRDICDNSLDSEVSIGSTSNKFIIKDNCDIFSIYDSEKKVLGIEIKHSTYEKNNSISNSLNISCNFPKLKELLLENENVLKLYQHIHFYEDNVSKIITKKLTNC